MNADEGHRQNWRESNGDEAVSFLSIYLKDSKSAHQRGVWTLGFTV